MTALRGHAWTFGRDIDTDLIIPARYLNMKTAEELAAHVMEDADPTFAARVQPGDIIVAKENFGCGSSREHAPIAIKACGVSVVIAGSFARIFLRNSINIGLPVIEASIKASDGDEIVVDLAKGEVRNMMGGTAHFAGYPPFVMMLVEKGGLVPYTKEVLGCKR